jgi:hypothetical protein
MGFPKHVKFSDTLLKKFNFGIATASYCDQVKPTKCWVRVGSIAPNCAVAYRRGLIDRTWNEHRSDDLLCPMSAMGQQR